MNAKQRRTSKRKVITEARNLGLDIPSWMGVLRIEQLIREEINRRLRIAKRRHGL
jgi:hypothetical protein